MLKLVGYGDRLSVAPGETISFMVSADGPTRYRAGIVRLIHGDANPAGPGFKARPVASDVNGTYPGRRQEIDAGSYVVVPDHPVLHGLASFTLAAMIWPTTPDRGRQAIIVKGADGGAGFALCIDDGGVALALSDGDGATATVATAKSMLSRHWYLAAASLDAADGTVTVIQRPLVRHALTDHDATVTRPVAVLPGDTDAPLTLAAAFAAAAGGRRPTLFHYNGKIDGPRIFGRAMTAAEMEALFAPGSTADGVVAAWDFAREIRSRRVVDTGPNGLHGSCVNLPARAMKGWNWTGDEMNWTRAPEQYGAIHFREDDLYDAGWEVDFAWTVPADTPSGVYCAHVASEDGAHEDYMPFAVRPPRGTATADIAFLMPTASYLAYANDHNSVDGRAAEMLIGRLIELQSGDMFIDQHREYGLACYDKHADGSGVCHSSRLRPILNMRPKYSSWLGGAGSGLWQFNADTHLIDWLDDKGFACDVITDEDLHAEGAALLKPYRAILTGTHPEYHSTRMWDAMKAYLDGGGRLMYLGANGWYWRIAWHADAPGVMEVRRAEDGIRTWEAEPGEYHHGFTGEYGGLWRRQGRPPNVMVGTGFTAQGFDLSSYYVRRPDSFDPRAGFIFAGVGADERIGDFGLVGGGAAGLELDRVEPLLGTPPNTLLLASSEAHTDLYLLVNEEFTVTTPDITGSQHPNVRADLAFFETPAGGAVFSVGSIAWCGSLSHNGYDNNVSRITENVLRRFVEPEPFAV